MDLLPLGVKVKEEVEFLTAGDPNVSIGEVGRWGGGEEGGGLRGI